MFWTWFWLSLITVLWSLPAQALNDEKKLSNKLDQLEQQMRMDPLQALPIIESLSTEIDNKLNPRLHARLQTLACSAHLATGKYNEVNQIAEPWIATTYTKRYYQYWAELTECLALANLYQGNNQVALQLTAELSDKKNLLNSHWVDVIADRARGVVLGHLDQESTGLELLILALKNTRKHLNNDYAEMMVISDIANIYSYNEQHDKAQEYYRLLLTQSEKLGQIRNQAVIHYNIGDSLEELQQYDQAIASFQQSKRLATQIDDVRGIAYAQLGLATTQIKQQKYEQALADITVAERLFEQLGEKDNLAQALIVKAQTYRELGELDNSLATLINASQLTKNTLDQYLESVLLRELSISYAAKQEYQKAYHYLSEYQKTYEEINDLRTQELISEQLARFELNENERDKQLLLKENQLKTLQIERQHSRTVIIVIALTAAIVIVLILVRLFNKERRLSNVLNTLANTDELTQLNNRRQILAMLESEVTRAKRYQQPLSIMIFDIDHFKNINDTHGHSTGDEVLRQVAQTANDLIRNEDRLGRIGGEEFLVILPMTNKMSAAVLADRIRIAVASLKLADSDQLIKTSISIGIAELTQNQQDGLALMQDADSALYDAKHAGRNTTIIFES